MNAINPPFRPIPAVKIPALKVKATPASRRFISLIASLTVLIPTIGSLAALALALRYGVSSAALAVGAVMFLLTGLGISMGFHRHFTHRSFRTSRLLSTALLILGSMAMEGSLLFWAASHRRHHQFSDTGDDTHSPYFKNGAALGWWKGLLHSHVGWLFVTDITNSARFAPDIIRDPRLLRLQGYYVGWVALGLVLPAIAGFALTRTAYGTLECFLWGGPIRMAIVHHADWAVGSFSHMYGKRPFKTDDHSANNILVAIFSFGEGLQNNHHAFPTMARHALNWWEPDLAGWTIRILARAGIVWDVKHPSPQAVAARRITAA